MAELYFSEDTPQRIYWDRKYYTSFEEQVEALHGSSTLYVGNLSFYTTELQIYETFSRVGPIKRIIMGLNRETKTPCGFCFVEYFSIEHARECLKFISGTMCDDHIIRCELDGGFKQGRQFGRGASGGQIRDERRTDIDLGRGGVAPKSFLGKRNTTNREYDRRDSDRGYNDRRDYDRRERRNDVDDFGRDRRDFGRSKYNTTHRTVSSDQSSKSYYEDHQNNQNNQTSLSTTSNEVIQNNNDDNNNNHHENNHKHDRDNNDDDNNDNDNNNNNNNNDDDIDDRPRKNPRFRQDNDNERDNDNEDD